MQKKHAWSMVCYESYHMRSYTVTFFIFIYTTTYQVQMNLLILYSVVFCNQFLVWRAYLRSLPYTKLPRLFFIFIYSTTYQAQMTLLILYSLVKGYLEKEIGYFLCSVNYVSLSSVMYNDLLNISCIFFLLQYMLIATLW